MPQYNLVNPLILGTLNTSIEADNSQIAAREIYQRISKYFGKVQNKFIFTLQQSNLNKSDKSDKNKFYSFKVNEVEKDNGEVDYTIANFTGGVDKNKLLTNINYIQKKINTVKKYKLNNDAILDSESISNNNSGQEGGKNDEEEKMFKKALDELDDELDDINSSMKYKKKNKVEMVNVITSPINYITVPDLLNPIDYYLYSAIYKNLNTIMIPTFIPTINPTIKLYLGP